MSECEVLKTLEDLASEWASLKNVKDRVASTDSAFRFINNLSGSLAFRKQYFIRYYSMQKVEAIKGAYK